MLRGFLKEVRLHRNTSVGAKMAGSPNENSQIKAFLNNLDFASGSAGGLKGTFSKEDPSFKKWKCNWTHGFNK